jgi:hypothetical protein
MFQCLRKAGVGTHAALAFVASAESVEFARERDTKGWMPHNAKTAEPMEKKKIRGKWRYRPVDKSASAGDNTSKRDIAREEVNPMEEITGKQPRTAKAIAAKYGVNVMKVGFGKRAKWMAFRGGNGTGNPVQDIAQAYSLAALAKRVEKATRPRNDSELPEKEFGDAIRHAKGFDYLHTHYAGTRPTAQQVTDAVQKKFNLTFAGARRIADIAREDDHVKEGWEFEPDITHYPELTHLVTTNIKVPAATTVTVRRRIPENELSTEQLVQRIKAEYLNGKVGDLYGRFVQARDLKPEIDAREFLRLYHSVSPNDYVVREKVPFKPTHFDLVTQRAVQVTQQPNGYFDILWPKGMTGGEPAGQLSARFSPIPQEAVPAAPKATGLPSEKEIDDAAVQTAGTHTDLRIAAGYWRSAVGPDIVNNARANLGATRQGLANLLARTENDNQSAPRPRKQRECDRMRRAIDVIDRVLAHGKQGEQRSFHGMPDTEYNGILRQSVRHHAISMDEPNGITRTDFAAWAQEKFGLDDQSAHALWTAVLNKRFPHMAKGEAPPAAGTYRYHVKSTGDSSARYGPCEVCGKHASEVFHQWEERAYDNDRGEHSGWSRHNCRDLWGHKECLESQRR